MLGVIVNTVAVLFGSTIGLLFKKAISDKIAKAAMSVIALCTLYIGISGALKGENTLILIISMLIGTIIGTFLDLDGKIESLGQMIEKRFRKKDGQVSVAQGFVTASLLFCMGSMTIVGSLNAGIFGDNELLYTKSLLDFFSSIMLSVSLGIGVLCSGSFVFVFQGLLVLLAVALKPILTDSAIAEMTCAGSVMIIGISLNMLGVTKLKIANYLPALVVAPILCYIVPWITNILS